MENEFYFEDTSPKKVKTIVAILGIILLLFIVVFIIYTRKHTLSIRNELVFELGSKVPSDVTKYVSNKVIDSNDYQLILNKVSISDGNFDKVGKYTFKVKYKNITRTGSLLVKDTIKPEVELESLTVGLNETYIPDDFLSVCEDKSKPCKVTFKNEDDADLSKKTGTYKVDLLVKDAVGNSVTKTGELIVKKGYSREAFLKNDLKIAYADPTFSDWNNQLVIKFKKGVMPDEIEESEYYTELMDFTTKDMHEYLDPIYANNLITEMQLMSVYNKHGYIIGYAVRVDLDNGLHFYLSK